MQAASAGLLEDLDQSFGCRDMLIHGNIVEVDLKISNDSSAGLELSIHKDLFDPELALAVEAQLTSH